MRECLREASPILGEVVSESVIVESSGKGGKFEFFEVFTPLKKDLEGSLSQLHSEISGNPLARFFISRTSSKPRRGVRLDALRFSRWLVTSVIIC